jgi:hypothetical protein
MKNLILLLLCCLPAFSQNPDAIKYAPRQVLLVDPTPGTQAVLPMLFVTDGQQHLEFIPVNQIKESIDKGGRPVTFADILSILGAATEKVNQLQAENDRLWKVAMKDAPKPDTVIVQQSGPSQADIAAQQQAEAYARKQQAIQMWLAFQNANRTQNLNVNVTNCTRYPALCVR